MLHRSGTVILALCIALLLLVSPACARDTVKQIPPPNVEGIAQFYPTNVISHIYHAEVTPHWITPDTFWFTDQGRLGTTYKYVDISKREIKDVWDKASVATALTAITGGKVDRENLTIESFEIAPGGGFATFSAIGDVWTYDLATNNLSRTAPKKTWPSSSLPSPDRSKYLWVNGSNLWVTIAKSGESYPLTTDGTEDYFYGKRSGTVSNPVTEARFNETPVPYAVWSPDSSWIRTFRVDQREVKPLYLLQDAPTDGTLRPHLFTYKYAMPGDEHVPQYEPIVIDLNTRNIIPIQYRPQPEVSSMDTEDAVLQWWSASGDTIWSLFIERGEKILRLLAEDPVTGRVREVINETGPTYIEPTLYYASQPNIAILSRSGDIIWFSERDGWGHLYRYYQNGTLKNQITQGDWVVLDLLSVNEETSTLYFTAGGREPGRDPYYRHLYRIGLDGTGLSLLTPEDADHAVSLSPDRTTFIDTISRVDLPPTTIVRSCDGAQLMTIATADISDIEGWGWQPPERFSVIARDGVTRLYGLLFFPTDKSSDRQYPLVEVVYPGPYTIVTRKAFPADLSWDAEIFWTCQMIAQEGYAVMTMDGMGTAYRSKAFHDISYGNLSDCGLPDHLLAISNLGERYPLVNSNKVGIYGKSAGGFMSSQALLTYPDTFRVGVAASGDYDCRLYGSYWGEKYEGFPVGDSYDEQTTGLKAANLTGKLLLMTGDLDDNVNPSMTMQLVNSLIKANKTFDLCILPNRNHDLNYEPYYLEQMMAFFAQHLRGMPGI